MDLIEKTGVQLSALRAGHIDLSNSAGRVTTRILGAMARMESEQMGEHIKSRLAANSKAGRPSGGPCPFGYKRVGGRLVLDPGVLARCMPRRPPVALACSTPAVGHLVESPRPPARRR